MDPRRTPLTGQADLAAPPWAQERRATVRVMTWNIHGGVGPDGRHDLERIAALIRQVDPHVLALQEGDSRRIPDGEHPTAMLDRIRGHRGVGAAAITTADGDYGQVLMSRWPLLATEIHDISVPGREPRRAIATLIESPAGPLCLVAAHLGLRKVERRRQAAQLAALARARDFTTVMLEDFNDWFWPGSIQDVLARELPARTRHRTFPTHRSFLSSFARVSRCCPRPSSSARPSFFSASGRMTTSRAVRRRRVLARASEFLFTVRVKGPLWPVKRCQTARRAR